MTAWTPPRTWTIGELVTKAIMDTYIRDNQLHLDETKAEKIKWVPVTFGDNGLGRGLFHVTANLGTDDYALVELYIPDDYNSIVQASMVCALDNNNATADIDIANIYGAVGENINLHAENDNATTYNMTQDDIYELDFSGIMTGIAAGDYCGLSIRNREAIHVLDVLGFIFRYL